MTWIAVVVGPALILSGCDRRQTASDGGAVPGAGPTSWFTEITSEAGLGFVHEPGTAGAFHMPEIMGAGAAFLDYDGDGDLDIYLTSGNAALPDGSAEAGSPDRLFQRDADGHYLDVTEAAGLGDTGYGMGVAVGDIDNDGDPDLYVANFGDDRLYRNDGDATFTENTARAGVSVGGWSTSAAFLDFDRDGFLDLYVCRYLDYGRPRPCADPTGRPDYCGPRTYPPVSDVLLRNTGNGSFDDVSAEAGITRLAAAGLGVVCEDLDGDGWIDIYVANDGYANHLWLNRHDGTFEERALILGCAVNLSGAVEAGMGVVAADFDGDADLDLLVTHQAQETNTLYLNQGEGSAFSFIDATAASGLAVSSVRSTGFGLAAFDADLDGDLDVLAVGGGVHRAEPHPAAVPDEPFNLYAEPNLFYINEGPDVGSLHFQLRSDVAGGMGGTVEVSRGLAMGDIDGDGDVDLLIANISGPARLYRNDTPRRGHWLTAEVVDPDLRRPALGARVTVVAGRRRFVRTVSSAGSYLSSNDARVHFGLGDRILFDSVEVRWPDGRRERFAGGEADRKVTLLRGSGEAQP